MKNRFPSLFRKVPEKEIKREPSLEERAHAFQEKLKDPNYFPSYAELRPLADSFSNEEGDSVFPTREDGIRDFAVNNHIFEVFTQEYIEKFSGYLKERIANLSSGDEPITILEVGAGNGKLSHLLKDSMKDLVASGKVKLVATDSGDWEIDSPWENVEKLEVKDALKKYHPNIVISSWMPHGEDWTKDFREEKSVKEYVLIGPYGPCGSDATWEHTRPEFEKMYGDKELAKKMQPSSFDRDGFIRTDHGELSEYQISRLDIGGEAKTISEWRSGTTSFIKS
ncbi:MAG: uncharacterized protein JWN64_518 [Parcubacteria group bacterium]|nr:uncharacterized protein [Parcubacteria group bacterium]